MIFAEIIYGLAGPDGLVRYVGRTYQPKRRFRGHHSQRGRVGDWVRQHRGQVRMVVLEDLGGEDKRCCHGHLSRERFWIQTLTLAGADLLNQVHLPSR